ncbi:MAG TPA: DUF547 domain-containing protein [Myxococcota bacterium]|nr:DUF547 domain-containing protein [Myxococcota bacterium]
MARLLPHLLLAMTTLVASQAAHAELDRAHAAWTALLAKHVKLEDARGRASRVDYAAFAQDRAALRAYLDSLARVTPGEFSALPRAEQIAYWINAYNAATVELILGEYPKHASIRDYGSLLRSPWQRPFVRLLGETLSLDEIEHERLRGPRGYREPRIHFAVNCASIGCPMLREEAYTGAKLEAQLEEQTVRFLADRTRNRADSGAGVLELSPIFDWYRDDFAGGDLPRFLARYAGALVPDEQERRRFAAREWDVEFGDYDWRLNDVKRSSSAQPSTGSRGVSNNSW